METGGDEGSGLLSALRQARADPASPLTRSIAVLWTWLDRHLLTLGSLREKPGAIRSAALRSEGFAGDVTDDVLAWVSEEPLRNAAELLARMELYLVPREGLLAERVPSIDGSEVVVAWRDPALAIAVQPSERPEHDDPRLHDERPPSADEHPSLSTLAPRLSVSPVYLRGIEVELLATDSKHWHSSQTKLRTGVTEPAYRLAVHLDTLGPHGMSGWKGDDERSIGCFEPATIIPEDHQRCEDAARLAVRRAAGESTVLVMPELSATPRVHSAIVAELRRMAEEEKKERRKKKKKKVRSRSPALTVTGLYHMPPAAPLSVDRALVKDAPLATRVNEAVALAPDGTELWRHRKLSSAEGRIKKVDAKQNRDDADAETDEPDSGDADSSTRERSYVEDIVLGTKLAVAQTPIGMVAILICLDAFAGHIRERVQSSPAEVLLVPSLSPHVHRHRDSVQHLVQGLWGAAFVCNRGYATGEESSVWNEPNNRSFWAIQREAVHVPRKRPSDAHPSFVFRLNRKVRARESRSAKPIENAGDGNPASVSSLAQVYARILRSDR